MRSGNGGTVRSRGRVLMTAVRRVRLVKLRSRVNVRALGALATQQQMPWNRRRSSPKSPGSNKAPRPEALRSSSEGAAAAPRLVGWIRPVEGERAVTC